MIDFESINFRYLYHQFLLVKNLDQKTKMVIKHSGFPIRQDDNAMLIYGYIDHDAGISFELMCAAYVFDNGDVALEPPNDTTSFKFRMNSFQGDIEQFNDTKVIGPFMEKMKMINDGYSVSDDVEDVREIKDLDPMRAPGYPDDIVVTFFMEGYRPEGIWCRVETVDRQKGTIRMTMLNEPNAPFGKHIGDMVDVGLLKLDDGEIKPVAIL